MMRTFFARTFDFLASYGLACVLFLFLLLLTFLGTLEQVDYGIYEVQQRYFESLIVFPILGVIPIPLPGGYLVLSLLFVNLLCGGIIRVRKDWRRVGVVIGHFGILFLLFGGFIEYQFSTGGHLTLYEGQHSDEFESYVEYEIAIYEENDGGETREWLIPGEKFTHLTPQQSRRFQGGELPFDLVLHGYRLNTEPRHISAAMGQPSAPVVDEFYLTSLPREPELELNIAGAYVTVEENPSGETHEGLLWAVSQYPYAFTASDGTRYAIELRKKRFPLPFDVTLNKFTRELHPRTEMAAYFSSDITKVQDGVSQEIHIAMNEPLRHEGYTLYQASWGPQDAGPNDPLFSTFAVVRNPADQIPLWACIVITLGLTIHFSIKLTNYLRAQSKRAAQ